MLDATPLPLSSESTGLSRKRRHQQKKRQMVREIKEARSCVDCGYDGHFAAKQFDHLPGQIKMFEVSQVERASKQRILDEIDKCEVVCANCHAIRTYERAKLQREAEDA